MNDCNVDILYYDDDIVIALKPPGINSTDVPGGMPEKLRDALHTDDIKTVHRLDQMVSGLMLFARGAGNARILSNQIIDQSFCKFYLAVTQGQLPEKNGQMVDYLHRNREERKSYVVSMDTPNSQLAQLRYQVIREIQDLSLVKIKLITGRTHQIRCQFSHRGVPIAGDRKYGLSSNDDYPIALWSSHISFCHPATEKRIIAEKNPPQRKPWDLFSLPEISNEIAIL